MRDLSILIPSRQEPFLRHTIEDILARIEADTEIIAVCDGALPVEPIDDHPRVKLVLLPKSIGQRAATNLAARMSKAKFIMKLDAHCALDQGFDVKLMADCEYDWTVVGKMYNLHVFDWACKVCGHRRYMGPLPTKCLNDACPGTEFEQIIVWKPRLHRLTSAYRFDANLHFQYFREYTKRLFNAGNHGLLTDTMSLLGACWFLHRDRYWELGGLDERHTSWGQMGTEIACATWLTGGRLVCNQKTWFSHMFRTQSGFSFPYEMDGKGQAYSRVHSRWLWVEGNYPKMLRPLSSLVEQFAPVPDWTDEALENLKKIERKKWGGRNGPLVPFSGDAITNGQPRSVLSSDRANSSRGNQAHQTAAIIYYTDCLLADPIYEACQRQLARACGTIPITSVSLGKGIDFGENIIIHRQRGAKTLFLQLIAGLEASTADFVFFCEHDVLYDKSCFAFTPPRDDVFYYNVSLVRVSAASGKAVGYQAKQLSGLCANRLLLLEHYYRRLARMALTCRQVAGEGRELPPKWPDGHSRFTGWEPGANSRAGHEVDGYKSDVWQSAVPYIDIRDHGTNFSRTRWKRSLFWDKSTCEGWHEFAPGELIPGWPSAPVGCFSEFLADLSSYVANESP